MLHLAIIGIVCAVSAPVEGTAFINRKNNESNVFCHFEGGEKNVTSPPNVYDVFVPNCSECAREKITNRTSFFYEYMNQYRDSKNSSCSIMERVSSGMKKWFRSNVSFPYRQKRSSLFRERQFSPKTLRPPLDAAVNSRKSCNLPRKLDKILQMRTRNYKSDLTSHEKKLFFRLKRPSRKRKRKSYRGHKRHLDRLKVDDELDLNKRIEKLVQEIALENQRKESSSRGLALSDDIRDECVESNCDKDTPKKASPFEFFNRIKKIFNFSKNRDNNKNDNNNKNDCGNNINNNNNNNDDNTNNNNVGVSSVSLDSARGSFPQVSDKPPHISSYDLLKTMRKSNRFRRNAHASQIPYRYSGETVYENELIEKSYPHSAHFIGKRHFRRRKIIPGERKKRKNRNMRGRKARRRRKKVKNWPLFKRNSPEHDRRLRRDGTYTSTINSSDGSTIQNVDSETPRNEEKSTLGYNEESSSFLTTSEGITESTVGSASETNMTDSDVPEHTLEKPLLEPNFGEGNLERTSDYSPMTELPLYPSIDFQLTPKYKYKLANEKYLTPDRYLEIRHALRSNLVHNNIFHSGKRTVNPDRRKRWSRRSRKSCRSPPLLCIPYIKKGQDDQLRYIIKILQSMIGKPFPPKIDIFERTKYKPKLRKEEEDCGDYSQDDDYTDYTSDQSTPEDCDTPPICPPPCPRTTCPTTTTCLTTTPATCPPITCPPTCPPVTCRPTCPPVTCRPTCPPVTCPPTCPPVTCPPTCPPVTCPSCQQQRECNSCTTTPPPICIRIVARPQLPCSVPVLEKGVDQTINCNLCNRSPASIPSPNCCIQPNTPCCPPPTIPTAPICSSSPQPPPNSMKVPPKSPTTKTSACMSTNRPASPPPPVIPCKVVTEPSAMTMKSAVARSESPNEKQEYFSFEAFTYNDGPQCGTETYQYSETTKPQNTQPPHTQLSYTQLSHTQPSYTQLSHTQPSYTQLSHTQPSYTQLSCAQLPYTQPSHTQSPHTQSPHTQSPYTQSPHTQPSHTQSPQTQQPPFPLCNTFQRYYPRKTICEECRTISDTPPTTKAPFHISPRTNTKLGPITQKFPHFKGYRKQFRPEYILRSAYMRRDQRNRRPLNGLMNNPTDNPINFPLHDFLNEPLKTKTESPDYEDQFNPPTKPDTRNAEKYEIAQNRLFRMHHKTAPKKNSDKVENEDYDFDDKYPEEDQKQKEFTFSLHIPPWSPWKDYDKQKTIEVEKRSKSTRQKRGDNYYNWPEDFENYNDYLDDPSYDDENHRGMPASNVRLSDTWTPPSYDMFKELVKAVTDNSTPNDSPTDSNRGIVTNNSTTVFNGNTATDISAINSTTPGSDTYNIRTKTTTSQTHTNDEDQIPNTSPKSMNGSTNGQNDSTPSNDHIPNTSPKSKNGHETQNNSTPSNVRTKSVHTTSNSTTEGCKKKKKNFFSSNKKKTKTAKSDGTDSSRDRGDDSKRRKTAFFPSNTKTTDGSGTTEVTNTKDDCELHDVTTTKNLKKDKDSSANQNADSAEEGQMPTTLKIALIAKGQKKLVTKLSPKVYTKVYPESLDNEPEVNDMTIIAKATTATTIRAKTTPLQSSTSTVDLKLQILAVCEGYLEVIKLIKVQKLTPGDSMDMDLARYCENIISQSFNYQLDKSKKPDITEPTVQSLGGYEKIYENSLKPETENDLPNNDILDTEDDDYIYKEEPEETVKSKNPKRKKNRKNSKNLVESATENETSQQEEKPESGKKKRKKKSHRKERQQEQQPTTEDADDILTKGVAQEQIELIKLLKRRKKALLSWLMNTREKDKADDLPETEYFEDNDMMESDIPQDSGTVKPKRDEKTSGTSGKKLSFVNESIFPVYAKQYGYNSGGEVREVEVLWRKVNEKTHEKKIFKNVSVLALLLTSTNAPDLNGEDIKFVGSNENDEIQFKSENTEGTVDSLSKSQTTGTTKTTRPSESSTACAASSKTAQTKSTDTTISPKKNATHTIITKPDASTIVGRPPKMNKTHLKNITHYHKVSHRFGAAKDLFQEYSIVFLDYAVYILPIMFTILFLFCCLCCAVHILQTRKSHKRRKKKKKLLISSETTETTDSEFESKKRKRESKRKRKSKEGSVANVDTRRGKKFWNVLKLHPTRANSEANESSQTEQKRSFLRFLKGRRDDDKTGRCRLPLYEAGENAKISQESSEGKQSHHSEKSQCRGRKKEEETRKTDGENEAAERRELIALLEELKKIETEQTEEKKEVKSVHVQYMSQEDENVFQRPEFSYPYEKNVFGLPKGYSFYSKQPPFDQEQPAVPRGYELYDGVNELTELLPCECSYYSQKRNEYCDFRISPEGRCKRFLNVFRDSGVSRSKRFVDKNCRKNESENRTFIFNKYRSINSDESDGLLGVTHKNAGTEVRFMENSSSFAFRPESNADLVEDMENFKRQLNNKKNIRLKDDGVLCRL